MHSLISILLLIQTTNSALFLWTPRPILLPAFTPFTYKDYTKLLNDLDHPPITAFYASTLEQALRLGKVLDNNNTLYLLQPSIDISEEVEVQEITDETLSASNLTNRKALVILTVPETFSRLKRDIDNDTVTNEESIHPFEIAPEPVIKGAVLYAYAIDENHEVMIYSSKPLSLYVDEETIYLGNASMTFIDVRESYTRLIARFTSANQPIIFLRFIFSTSGGYWYLNFIEAELNSIKYNLALLSTNITAPNHMSYHCEGKTVFADTDRNTTLYLYDVQVQPDAHKHRFSDAYNCIPFITAPILSGLFVASIMCIGLAFGLTALASIKTMDKFDNPRTKQLTLTLFE